MKKTPAKKISVAERKKLEKRFPGWKFTDSGATATLTLRFKKHVDAVVFIARLSVQAEVIGHHPELLLKHASVQVTIGTNAALTELDFTLMDRIESIIAKK